MPSAVFDVDGIRDSHGALLVPGSAIARRYYCRPEQKLAHRAENTGCHDQHPPAWSQPQPRGLPSSLDSPESSAKKSHRWWARAVWRSRVPWPRTSLFESYVVEKKCLHAAREQTALSKLGLHVVSKGSDSDKICDGVSPGAAGCSIKSTTTPRAASSSHTASTTSSG